MKKPGVWLAWLLVLAVGAVATGCSERIALIDTFTWLPEGYGDYVAWDVGAVRNDPIRETWVRMAAPWAQRLEWMEIESDQVDYFAFATDGAGHEVDIIVGDVDTISLRRWAHSGQKVMTDINLVPFPSFHVVCVWFVAITA